MANPSGALWPELPYGAWRDTRDTLQLWTQIVGKIHLALKPRSVADFYGAVMSALAELGIPVAINEYPCEIAGAISFSTDKTHSAYDPIHAHRFWQVLLQSDRVLKEFRTCFIGKVWISQSHAFPAAPPHPSRARLRGLAPR